MLKERLVFTAGDVPYHMADVIAAARRWGHWEAVERSTRERLACRERAAAEGDPLAVGAVEQGVERWRRARRLISAEETREWLLQRELSLDDVHDHVRGALLVETWSEEVSTTVARYEVDDELVAERVYAEGVCSGVLWDVARRLAARAALLSNSGRGEDSACAPVATTDRLSELDEAFERFRDGLLTPAALEKEVGSHQLDWLFVQCKVLAFPHPDAAREAALAVRSDAAALTDVARRAGTAVEERRLYLEEAAPGMRDLLLSAREGELIGPLEADDGYLVVLMSEKTPPSSTDTDVRRRAEAALMQRAVDREVASKVRWHAGL